MPRRGNIAKRDVLADPIYNSKMVTRLVNSIMLDGKKGVAQKIVYGAFDIVSEKTGNDPLEMFEKALENIMPLLDDTFGGSDAANLVRQGISAVCMASAMYDCHKTTEFTREDDMVRAAQLLESILHTR